MDPRITFPNPEDKPYIEYTESLNQDHCLHFTFKTTENIGFFLEKAKQWKLPVELHGNRIVILAKGGGDRTGVFFQRVNHHVLTYYDFLGIQFSSQVDADEFYQLEYENFRKWEDVANKNQRLTIPFMSKNTYVHEDGYNNRNNAGQIVFKKEHLLKYSLYKKVEDVDARINQAIFCIFALHELKKFDQSLPTELIFLIIRMNFSEQDLQLHNQHIKLPEKQKKIDCYIGIDDVLKNFHCQELFLICENKTDLSILACRINDHTKLAISDSYSYLIREHNLHAIEINHNRHSFHGYGVSYTENNKFMNIKFVNEYEAETFLDLVNIQVYTRENETVSIQPARCKNIITIPVALINNCLKENKIRKIFHDIDKIIDNLNNSWKANINKGLNSLWVLVDKGKKSEEEAAARQMKIACLTHLKICIRQGVYDEKQTDEVISDWLKYVNVNNNIFDMSELEDFLEKYDVKPAVERLNS